MKQEKLFDLLKAAVSPCECVKAAKQELLENGFEEIETYGEIVYELSYNKNYNKYPFVLKKITQQ